MSKEKIHTSFKKVKDYVESAGYKGYDPYDGLNSPFFQAIPLLPKIRFARLVWIQFFKRSPLNLRKFVGIKPEYNPKALGLFVSTYCELYTHQQKPEYLDKIKFLVKEIMAFESKGYSGACWGYNFDWESRAFFQPKFTPTIVASSFIANALMDAYEITGEKELLLTARSTCDFILKDLNRTAGKGDSYAFSYSPIDKSVVYNASLLGARLMSRVYKHSGESMLAEEARKVVSFCCDHQRGDGSWSYGTLPFHQWIDNFHTGYNLECIHDYMQYTGDNRFRKNLDEGFTYYINTFFTPEGIARYYSDSTYPIDIHAPAQLVITCKKLGCMDQYREKMETVLGWTIDHMQDKKGYFYYQVNKYFTSRIPYMRWAQAWMFLSFAIYLCYFTPKSETV